LRSLIFEGTSADYEAKSSEGIFWEAAYTWKEVEKPLQLPKRTLHAYGCFRTIRGGCFWLFLRQGGAKDATFLPEVVDFKLRLIM